MEMQPESYDSDTVHCPICNRMGYGLKVRFMLLKITSADC